jgi:GTP-binding protein Era
MKNFVLLPLSGSQDTNIDKLIDIIFDLLPEGELLYPSEIICDVPQKVAIADIIREKFFHLMREEVPHSLAVFIEDMQPKKKKTVYIRALIYVERDSQKEIVIGKGGSILKEAGTAARKELEELLEKKVFLELLVKAQKNWREDPDSLEQMGYVF